MPQKFINYTQRVLAAGETWTITGFGGVLYIDTLAQVKAGGQVYGGVNMAFGDGSWVPASAGITFEVDADRITFLNNSANAATLGFYHGTAKIIP